MFQTRYTPVRSAAALLSFCFVYTLIDASCLRAERPRPNLPETANGQAAIALLGPRLPAVAEQYGFRATELQMLFIKDHTLWVDRDGSLLYVEPEPTHEMAETPTVSEAPAQNPYPPSSAFFLHSNPGSTKTIFLDFDGHLVHGTAWNSSLGSNFQAPAFDLDGDPNSFNDSERNRIIGIWRRVAEDFAGLDVNVTTEDPGEAALTRSSNSDQVFGTRALITKRNATCSSCGGVAYVGTFDSTNGSYYQPAWVFYDALGNGNEKYTAEATSHEVGHNGGLSHDGTSSVSYYQGHGSGATGWAPIMGVGYYKQLTQWSKGEYIDANNTQDDFAILAANGIATLSDDHGNSRQTATHLNQGAQFEITGIIEQRTDSDYFSISAGIGEVTVVVDEHTHGPNLDIELTLFDSNGVVLGQANPETLLEAGLAFHADREGIYFIRIEGAGFGTPATGYSDYGSLGYYKLSGSMSSTGGNQPPQAILEAAPTTGIAPLSVSLDGSSSVDPDGVIASHHWSFGDGASASGSTVSHTFQEGSYTVTLTVTDDSGASNSAEVVIVVDPAPANISAPTNLTASVNGSTVTLTWNDTSNNEDGFRVYRGLESGKGKNRSITWSEVSQLPSESTSYNDTGVADGTYHYYVEAFDSTGQAASSSIKVNVSSGGKGGGGKGGPKNR